MQYKSKSNKARNFGLFLLYTITLLVPIGGLAGLYCYYQKQLDDIPQARIIVVSKQDMRLRVYDFKGTKLMDYGIACGRNMGQKHKIGDLKTPEGMFFVQTIEDASDRTHDFGDGRGEIQEPMDPTLSVWILREAKALESMERMILCLSVHELQRVVFA